MLIDILIVAQYTLSSESIHVHKVRGPCLCLYSLLTARFIEPSSPLRLKRLTDALADSVTGFISWCKLL